MFTLQMFTLLPHGKKIRGSTFTADLGLSVPNSSCTRVGFLWVLRSSPKITLTGHYKWPTAVNVSANGHSSLC